MLSCTSERNPCCGPKIAAERDVRILEQPIDDVREARVDRRRVADEPDTASGDQVTIDGEQAIDAGRDEPLANGTRRQA